MTALQDPTISSLKESPHYNLVSFRPSSVPSAGSLCNPTDGLREDLPIERVIHHRNGDRTLIAILPDGQSTIYMRFWYEPSS